MDLPGIILCRWSTRTAVDCGKGRGQEDRYIKVAGVSLDMEADLRSRLDGGGLWIGLEMDCEIMKNKRLEHVQDRVE